MNVRRAIVEEDLAEAGWLLERQERAVVAASREAAERRRLAAAHLGGPGDPRAQGLWDAAAFHAARARAAEARLVEVRGLAEAIRTRAAEARRKAVAPTTGGSPCG